MGLSNKFWSKISFFLISLYSLLNAQISQPINSYRMVGLGEFNFNENTATQSMGGFSTIYVSPFGNEINFFNPAANSSLEETVFNLSGSYDYVKYNNSLGNSTFNQLNFDRIALAFPINKKIKTGIGFRQNAVANVDDFQYITINETDKSFQIITDKYNGGLNNLQSFVSYSVSDKLSLGFKAEYIYGNLIKENVLTNSNVFVENSTIKNINDTIVTREIRRSDFESNKTIEKINQTQFTLGANYKIPLKKKNSLLVGATIGLGTSVVKKSNTTNLTEIDYTIDDRTTVKDTLRSTQRLDEIPTYLDSKTSNLTGLKTTLNSMQNFSFALGYEEEGKFMIGADFQFNKTGVFGDFINTQLVYNFNQIIDAKITYKDRYRIALGGWWLPNKNSYKKYFERVIYRAGVFYEQTPIVVDGKSINDLGASMGFALPVGKNAKNTLNLGLEYIKRGNARGLSTELDYFGVRMGFNFANKWFNQRLID